MKLKSVLAIAMILFLIIGGSIILFGTIDQQYFFWAYFTFGLLSVFLVLFLIKDMFKDKGDLLFLLFFLVVLLLPIAFFASNIKAYNEQSIQLSPDKEEVMQDLKIITSQNEYYVDYVNYLVTQIKLYSDNSRALQNSLDRINAEAQAIQQEQEKIIPNYDDHDEEEWEEDDD